MERGIIGMWEGISVGYIGQCALSGLFVFCSDWPRLAREAQIRSEQTSASVGIADDPVIEPSLGVSLSETDGIATSG